MSEMRAREAYRAAVQEHGVDSEEAVALADAAEEEALEAGEHFTQDPEEMGHAIDNMLGASLAEAGVDTESRVAYVVRLADGELLPIGTAEPASDGGERMVPAMFVTEAAANQYAMNTVTDGGWSIREIRARVRTDGSFPGFLGPGGVPLGDGEADEPVPAPTTDATGTGSPAGGVGGNVSVGSSSSPSESAASSALDGVSNDAPESSD